MLESYEYLIEKSRTIRAGTGEMLRMFRIDFHIE